MGEFAIIFVRNLCPRRQASLISNYNVFCKRVLAFTKFVTVDILIYGKSSYQFVISLDLFSSWILFERIQIVNTKTMRNDVFLLQVSCRFSQNERFFRGWNMFISITKRQKKITIIFYMKISNIGTYFTNLKIFLH